MVIVRFMVACGMVFLVQYAHAQTVSDHLILQDIGEYQHKPQGRELVSGQPRIIPGYATRTASGFLMSVDHFDQDHDDKVYETRYIHRTDAYGVDVQVVQHAGAYSDRWLLHEVEGTFRGSPEQPRFMGTLREINGNRIFTYSRGTRYTWISNNIVVDIRYTDLQKTKPEPIEIVQAYLRKHPCTVPVITVNATHEVLWIKDEMERRLWLGDKWFMRLQLGNIQANQALNEVVKSITMFLDYREKYYGMAAASEKSFLAGCLNTNNVTGIRNKIAEYNGWWSANKNTAIKL